MNVPLCFHRYVRKRTGTVKVPSKGKEIDLIIDSTGLNVQGKGGVEGT